jgi:hypothetical protein
MGDERRHIRWRTPDSSDADDADPPTKDAPEQVGFADSAHLSKPCAAVAHNAPALPLPAINGLPRLACPPSRPLSCVEVDGYSLETVWTTV